MTAASPTPFALQLLDDGVIHRSDATLTPLTGGVSSEIYRVRDGERQFVVKRALAKLKVSADWYADTSRNAMEQAYIRYVAEILPDSVPKLTYANPESGYFAMEFLDGFANWKEDMLAGQFNLDIASAAGQKLGKIHACSWNHPEVAKQFNATENFDQLRIDPYIRATAAKHPAVREKLLTEAHRLRQSRQCLMHGDYSPKNMLHRQGRLVILDCEVASYGDAAFDLAFLLNHLLLKGIYHAPQQTALPRLFDATIEAYVAEIGNLADQILNNTTRLLPMLLLARVDGKSPVEYLSVDKQSIIRRYAISCILKPHDDLVTLASDWYSHL